MRCPGTTLVCGDSHTCTHGGVGALAFGIGASEVAHVLATQTLVQQKPAHHAHHASTARPAAASRAKDMILARSAARRRGRHRARGRVRRARRARAVGRGPADPVQPVDRGAARASAWSRPTRPLRLAARAPLRADGAVWERASPPGARCRPTPARASTARCRSTLASRRRSPGAPAPSRCCRIDGRVPDPAERRSRTRRGGLRCARSPTWACAPGSRSRGRASTASSSARAPTAASTDLRAAAAVVARPQGRAGRARLGGAGLERVKRDAEAEGLDSVFRAAGFEWREPGCSMCVARQRRAGGARASAASPPPTATSWAGRGRARARTWRARPWRRPRRWPGAIADVRALRGGGRR